KDSLFGDSAVNVLRADAPIAVNRQVRNAVAQSLQGVAGTQDSVVFDWRGDEVTSFVSASRNNAHESKIVALRPTAHKDDFALVAPNDLGNSFSRFIDGL